MSRSTAPGRFVVAVHDVAPVFRSELDVKDELHRLDQARARFHSLVSYKLSLQLLPDEARAAAA